MAKPGLVAATFVAGLITLVSLFAGPSFAASPCTQWDFSTLSIRQGTFAIGLQFNQTDNNLQGNASFKDTAVGPGEGNAFGPMDGTVNGNEIHLTVFWNDGTVGAYDGVVGPTGRVEGTTYDKRNAGSKATWHSVSRLKCLASASDEPAPAPPPLTKKALGKKKRPPPPATEIDKTGVIASQSEGNEDACKSGYVWRVAQPEDLVCVTPKARARTAKENKRAAKFRDPDGAYGPNSCIEGYVWREAFEGDLVCVAPEIRDLVREENSLGPSRRVGG